MKGGYEMSNKTATEVGGEMRSYLSRIDACIQIVSIRSGASKKLKKQAEKVLMIFLSQ